MHPRRLVREVTGTSGLREAPRAPRERIGPHGEKRPQSPVEAAVKIGRISTGIEPKDSPRGPRRVLLRDWWREDG